MAAYMEEREITRLYLLGRLSDMQQQQLEERIIINSALFEELLIAEDELIDEYLSDSLSESERESFEKYFLLTPERQQKVRFARALRKYITAAESSGNLADAPQRIPANWSFLSFLRAQNRVAAPAIAVVILVVALAGLWLLFRDSGYLGTPRSEQHNILTVALSPLVREAGEIKRISVSGGIDTVRLQLLITAREYPDYRATLQSSEGAEIWVKDNLKPGADDGKSYITLDVPARLLKRDDYQVKLSGHAAEDRYEEVNRYPFRVVE
jgi:hypothetical protein